MDFHAASLTGNFPAERHPSAFNEAAPVLYRNTILRHLSTELAICVSAFMGVRRSLNRIYMQMPGTGYVSKIVDAQAEFSLGGEFQQLALRLSTHSSGKHASAMRI